MRFFRLSLGLQMLIATFLGIFCGLFFGNLCSVFGPWGTAYVMVLKITTIPYLICAIIHGVGRLASGTAKSILQKGFFFIAGAWTINISMIYLTVFLFPRAVGIPYASYSTTAPATLNFASILIPENIFSALANNVVPAIVVFGLLLGIAMMHLKEKQPFMGLVETLVEALTRITGWISRITPIGTFLIIAYQVGTIQLSTVKQVSTYLILYILATLVIVFWVFPRVMSMFTHIPARRWLKDLSPILLLGYTTNVVIVTLPFMIELIKKEIDEFYQKDGRIGDQVQGIVSIIFNLPLGSLFISVYVFFVSLFYHLPLSIGSQIQLFFTTFLTSLGAMGLGSWINSLNFLLDSLNLPLDAIDLYLTTLPFTAGFQSMVSVMEISSVSLFIALACHKLLTYKWHKILRSSALIVSPILLLALLLKIFNPLPPVSNNAKSIYELKVQAPVKVTTYTAADSLPAPRSGDVFERVLSSKVLRVGYNPDAAPFCFLNKEKKASGYDIAFAHQLAADLGCDLELIPMDFGALGQQLNAGLYDIGMSGVSLTERRLTQVCFSEPYITANVVFVMKKKYSKTLTSVEAILNHPHIKVAVLRASSYDALAHTLFPADRIIQLDKYDDFATYYPSAVLLRGQPQAISWSLRHPAFTVVIPTAPIEQDSLAYPVQANQDRFLCYLNQWLKLKKNEEFTQRQYNLWVLGRTETATPAEERWSVIRNVLHWRD
jgi:Na+/H+-dicarboxylate symporter/ABC-type amino acid transport substrate-binding protein